MVVKKLGVQKLQARSITPQNQLQQYRERAELSKLRNQYATSFNKYQKEYNEYSGAIPQDTTATYDEILLGKERQEYIESSEEFSRSLGSYKSFLARKGYNVDELSKQEQAIGKERIYLADTEKLGTAGVQYQREKDEYLSLLKSPSFNANADADYLIAADDFASTVQGYNQKYGDVVISPSQISEEVEYLKQAKQQKQQLYQDFNDMGVGLDVNSILSGGNIAKYKDVEVDDIRNVTVYQVWGVTKGNKQYRVLATYNSKAEAEKGLKDWKYGPKIKEAIIQKNFGKKTETIIEGEGDYVAKYRDDGSIESLSKRPINVTQDVGFSKSNQDKLQTFTFSPYVASFDTSGKLVSEKTFAVQATKYYRDSDWGSKKDYAVMVDAEVMYSGGQPKQLIDYDMFESSSQSSKGWAYKWYRPYQKQVLNYSNNDFLGSNLSTKKIFKSYESSSFVHEKQNTAGKDYMNTSSSSGIFLEQEYDYRAGLLTQNYSPWGKREYINSTKLKRVEPDQPKPKQVAWFNPFTGQGTGFYGHSFKVNTLSSSEWASLTPQARKTTTTKMINRVFGF